MVRVECNAKHDSSQALQKTTRDIMSPELPYFSFPSENSRRPCSIEAGLCFPVLGNRGSPGVTQGIPPFENGIIVKWRPGRS
jgi:hypothetical protein